MTASTSAALGMYTNFLSDATGIITNPINEYKQAKANKIDFLNSSTTLLTEDQAPISTNSFDSLQPPRPAYSRSHSPVRSRTQTAGAMAAGSAKSFGNVIGRPYKSIFVDVPLALTDGLDAVPKLYGSEVRERGKITDLKSGTIVAGKNFFFGIVDGFSGVVLEPYNGGKKEGALGVVKGVGKGALGFLAKTGAGE